MKKILIIGGSGTIGKAFIKEYYKDYEFYNYSRNESSLTGLKRQFRKVTNFIGAVEDYSRLHTVFSKVKPDIVIHAAALKHVNLAEENPTQTVETNIIGSLNVIKASKALNVPLTVGISTDKACEPDNVYGYSKSLMERMFLDNHTEQNKMVVCRFANVANSSGSVIPYWKECVKQGKPIPITDPKMTRLMFSKKEAVQLIYHSIKLSNEYKNEPFILTKKMKSVELKCLAKIINGYKWEGIEIVGKRPGEKLSETLIGENEVGWDNVNNDYITIYPTQKKTNTEILNNRYTHSYNSKNAFKMTLDEMKQLINENE